MIKRKKTPERRHLLDKEALMIQLSETLKALHPDWTNEHEDLCFELNLLLNDIYPELEKELGNNQKFFGGMPTDWSASSLFDYYL